MKVTLKRRQVGIASAEEVLNHSINARQLAIAETFFSVTVFVRLKVISCQLLPTGQQIKAADKKAVVLFRL